MILKKAINKFRILFIEKFPKVFRPSSYPYISGDSFRNFSDHVFDETGSIDPIRVKDNDIIFLKTDLKNIFFDNYHPLINARYILISHNSDFSIEEPDLQFIDEKIIHWFAAKLNTEASERISALPYGLENRRYLKNGLVSNFKKHSKNVSSISKRHKILCSFNTSTNPKHRVPLLKIAEKRKNLFDIKNFDKSEEYLNELSFYEFNLCPEGNNFESHRIWESLILRCTPIVEKNNVNQNFIDLGIPLIMLENLNELSNLEYKDLIEMNTLNKEKDYETFTNLDFWIDVINSKKV